MRIYLTLSKNTEIVPYNHQTKLVGALHKWLGNNQVQVHDTISLYSISWLRGGKASSKGLDFPQGATWFISAYNVDFIKQLVSAIMQDANVCYGMKVEIIRIQDAPNFGQSALFYVANPVFVKRNTNFQITHYTFQDAEANTFLTETLQAKLKAAGLPTEGVKVQFHSTYTDAKVKLIHYKSTDIRCSRCPVRVEGSPEQIAFAWAVGVGNGTGIGFGALQ